MKNTSNRMHVLLSILTFQSKACPYCKNRSTNYIGRNAPISQVRRCGECNLMFRWPKQTEKFNKLFYQLNYIKQAAPIQLPSPDEVKRLLASNFADHYTHLGVKLDIVKQFKTSGRLLVFGANWGYEVAQFCKAGFDAVGYEVSAPRATFARNNLNVQVFPEFDSIHKQKPYDVIYTSHTLEHLPTPEIALSQFKNLLVKNGLLVVSVPNCGGNNAKKEGVKWGPFSSELHPLSYSAEFFLAVLPKCGFDLVAAFSDPYDLQQIKSMESKSYCSGDELLIVARRSDAH